MRKRVRLTFGKVPERVRHSDVTERWKCSTGVSGEIGVSLISGARNQESISFHNRGASSMRYPLSFVLGAAVTLLPVKLPAQQMITGSSAFADWNQEQPGALR
jgi:hypothetical protein